MKAKNTFIFIDMERYQICINEIQFVQIICVIVNVSLGLFNEGKYFLNKNFIGLILQLIIKNLYFNLYFNIK